MPTTTSITMPITMPMRVTPQLQSHHLHHSHRHAPAPSGEISSGELQHAAPERTGIDTATASTRGTALVVFLENVGHIHGVPLPQWAQNTIDFVTEEYAKLLLWWHGAYARYDRVIILEDAAATGAQLIDALLSLGSAYTTDLLLLVHGRPGSLVGFRDREHVAAEDFARLEAIYAADPQAFRLRMVYGLNCYGLTLAPMWLRLGAQVVNGACGVNWLPEPSLSTFLRHWLRGAPYSVALRNSHVRGLTWGRRIWRADARGKDHSRIAGSRQVIFGTRDVTVHDIL